MPRYKVSWRSTVVLEAKSKAEAIREFERSYVYSGSLDGPKIWDVVVSGVIRCLGS